MKLEVIRANPAGNITLFVKTPVEKAIRGSLAEKLLAIEEFAAEQVGYYCEPGEGFDGHMEMAGGEFCGNASRAYGFLMAQEKGLTGKVHLTLDVSGSDVPVEVDADMDEGTARASMPLPRFVKPAEAGGTPGVLVHLGGIAHFVVEDIEPTEEFFDKAEAEIFKDMKELDAYGVMFTDSETGRLTPLVKVPAANSLYWEGSCGSGSLATAIAGTEGMPDGDYAMDLVQPAGTVRAEVTREGGKVKKAFIGGNISIDEPKYIEIQ